MKCLRTYFWQISQNTMIQKLFINASWVWLPKQLSLEPCFPFSVFLSLFYFIACLHVKYWIAFSFFFSGYNFTKIFSHLVLEAMVDWTIYLKHRLRGYHIWELRKNTDHRWLGGLSHTLLRRAIRFENKPSVGPFFKSEYHMKFYSHLTHQVSKHIYTDIPKVMT